MSMTPQSSDVLRAQNHFRRSFQADRQSRSRNLANAFSRSASGGELGETKPKKQGAGYAVAARSVVRRRSRTPTFPAQFPDCRATILTKTCLLGVMKVRLGCKRRVMQVSFWSLTVTCRGCFGGMWSWVLHGGWLQRVVFGQILT